jgi:hypothetical protein
VGVAPTSISSSCGPLVKQPATSAVVPVSDLRAQNAGAGRKLSVSVLFMKMSLDKRLSRLETRLITRVPEGVIRVPLTAFGGRDYVAEVVSGLEEAGVLEEMLAKHGLTRDRAGELTVAWSGRLPWET